MICIHISWARASVVAGWLLGQISLAWHGACGLQTQFIRRFLVLWASICYTSITMLGCLQWAYSEGICCKLWFVLAFDRWVVPQYSKKPWLGACVPTAWLPISFNWGCWRSCMIQVAVYGMFELNTCSRGDSPRHEPLTHTTWSYNYSCHCKSEQGSLIGHVSTISSQSSAFTWIPHYFPLISQNISNFWCYFGMIRQSVSSSINSRNAGVGHQTKSENSVFFWWSTFNVTGHISL